MSEHTPTPWKLDGDGLRTIIRGNDVTIVATRHRMPREVHEANFALIVRAVNSHVALVTALQSLHDNLAEYQRINNLGGFDNQDMRQAREALELARKK